MQFYLFTFSTYFAIIINVDKGKQKHKIKKNKKSVDKQFSTWYNKYIRTKPQKRRKNENIRKTFNS